jgi:ATP-dependent Clp protease ATP-binding subunit ClpC
MLCEVNDDMPEKFTDGARQVVSLAREEAEWLNHRCVGTEHILLGILRQDKSAAARALDSLEITLDGARQQVKKMMGEGRQSPAGHIPLTARAQTVFELSRLESSQLGSDHVAPEHILLGLIRVPSCLALRVLAALGVEPAEVREQVRHHLLDVQAQELTQVSAQAEPMPARLGQICRDLTQEAREGMLYPSVGRENEIKRIADVLGEPAKSIPVLVGSSSAALHAVVEGLAQSIITGHVPDLLREKRIYVFGSGDSDVLAGIIKQIHSRSEIILFIDRLSVLIKEKDGENSVGSSLQTALAGGKFQLIGAATLGEYRRHLQADGNIGKLLKPIIITEPAIMYSSAMLKEALRTATRTRIPRTY